MAKNYQADVEKFLRENEGDIKKWIKWRPSVTRSYDDLLSTVTSGEMKYNPVADKDWDWHKTKEGVSSGAGAYWSDKDKTINFKESNWEQSMPHETMHYLGSHWPGQQGTPKKINPYLKADMALKGWLPSIHPGGRRPTMPGKGRLSNWWNENMATQDAEYSNKGSGHKDKEGNPVPYHPWFDEHSFDIFDKKTGSVQRAPKEKEMAGGLGRIYQYLTDTAKGDYEVQKGETLSGIGQRAGQDWKDIASSNQFATNKGPYYEPGQRQDIDLRAGETLSGVRGEGRSLRDDISGLLGALKGIPGKFAGAAGDAISSARGPRSVEDYLNQASAGGFSDEGANRGLQESLRDAGFYSGDIDSQIGPMSTAAIRAYQADRDAQDPNADVSGSGYQGQGPPAPGEETAPQRTTGEKLGLTRPRNIRNPMGTIGGEPYLLDKMKEEGLSGKMYELLEKAKMVTKLDNPSDLWYRDK